MTCRYAQRLECHIWGHSAGNPLQSSWPASRGLSATRRHHRQRHKPFGRRRTTRQICRLQTEAASPPLPQPLPPGKLRCGWCYECGFTSLSHLAEHLTGRSHSHHFPSDSASVRCPYCGTELQRRGLGIHIREQKCPAAGAATIPTSQRRVVSHEELDQDARYAPIMQERVEGGLLKLRPMHMQHTFETAMLCSEAFQEAVEPTEFGRMLSELRWQAAHYEAHPGSVVHGVVDFQDSPLVDTPDISDVLGDAPPKLEVANLFSGPSLADKREQQRREVAQAWGVWVWIIAEFIPDDASTLREGTDSMVVGATAVMLHDRLATLEKFLRSFPHLKATDLNYNLFLASQPPLELEYQHAAFIWWTSVDLSFRRRGIAGKLLQACEAVGFQAGFWTFFIQADLKQQDRSGSIFPMPARRYDAALEAYRKAGYKEYSKKDRPSAFWSQSSTLMYKVFEP